MDEGCGEESFQPSSATIIKIHDLFFPAHLGILDSSLNNGSNEKRNTAEGQELSEFLFELSNYDRLSLLSFLESNEVKLSALAKKTGATVQETSRHLDRLLKSGLVDKKSSGEYLASSVGKLWLSQLESLEFIVHNRDYLFDHDLSVLPEKFVHRLGELRRSNFARNVTDVLQHTQAVLKGAHEYVFLMADQPLIPGIREENAFPNVDENVQWKSIIPRSEIPQMNSTPETRGNSELRFMDKPKVAIAMNEKIAGVTFLDLRGRLDMSAGFAGDDKDFHSWCFDLFYHYWDETEQQREPKTDFEF